MIVGIIGLGLIGGSIAKNIKNNGFASSIIGYSRGTRSCKNALKLKLVDRIVDFYELCNKSDIIILSIPVDSVIKILPNVLDVISSKSVVFDVGSTKEVIINSIKNHSKRKRFVASHPMSGTENSGPNAAKEDLFINKVTVICDYENSDPDALKLVTNLYQILGSRLIFMSAKDHDKYVSYVSHLSHIISYALSVLLLEKEKSISNIFDLASTGFMSIARLSKSSSNIWLPIFQQNKSNLVPIINNYIEKLNELKNYLEEDNFKKLYEYISFANQIKKVLCKNNKTSF